MYYRNPNRLEQSVRASGVIRPLKIAFIVPSLEIEETHRVLDEVFMYSYANWSGSRYLLIPFDEDFKDSVYLEWLDIYDADIVYSYCSLPEAAIRKIEQINSPAYLIEHEYGEDRQYTAVNIGHTVDPISSNSCIHSPYFGIRNSNFVPKILCQNDIDFGDRFTTDNFGNQTSLNNYLNAVSGLYETVCLTPEDTSEHYAVGTHRVHTEIDVIEKLANNEISTVSKLASIHSESVISINSYEISNSFHVVVGGSALDRINFWNVRHFHNERSVSCCSLILAPEQLLDDNFASAIGSYMNNQNFIGNNQRTVTLISSSVEIEVLGQIRDKLTQHTHNFISVAQVPDKLIVPTSEQLRNSRDFFKDKFNLLLSEDISEQVLPEPEHISFIPPIYKSHGAGNFISELLIDRHNNLSRYSNVIDSWLLPRRAYISRIFGSKCIRVSKNNQLVYLGGKARNPFGGTLNNTSSIEIHLPEDMDVINYTLVGRQRYSEFDKRHKVFTTNIESIAHSDKGRNFNGVISMFDSLNDTAELLTNKLWRDVFKSINFQNQDFIFDFKKLRSFCPSDQQTKNRLKEQLRITDDKRVKGFITAIFKDALEYLVDRKVISPIYNWACDNCGHQNIRIVDSLKLSNDCEICRNTHSMQIDDKFEWKYYLNKFIHKALYINHGLPVLWGLHQLQEINRRNSFFYLPEVLLQYDHRDPNNKNEIDLLGISDGCFFAGEAKRSANYFCINQREIEKFTNVIKEVFPDVAVLVFEQWSEKVGEVEETKRLIEEFKQKFSQIFNGEIRLQVLVFSELDNYQQLAYDFGVIGRHTQKLYDSWDKSC